MSEQQQPIRVLLVDDHPTVLWGLEKLINSAGPGMQLVGTATCRTEALERFEASRPHVVLLDLDLGEESGLDLLDELKAAGDVNVIVLTGTRDDAMHHLALLNGASGLVHKSEPAEVILQAIVQVQAGQLWLGRAAMARMLSSLSSADRERTQATKPGPLDELTAAECKVIAAVVKHRSVPNKVIADALHISSHTLRNHLASIYSKLEVHRRLDLVLYAMEHGLSDDDSQGTAPVGAGRALSHAGVARCLGR